MYSILTVITLLATSRVANAVENPGEPVRSCAKLFANISVGEWRKEQNHRVHDWLKKSPVKAQVEMLVRGAAKKDNVLQTAVLEGGATMQLVDRGLDQPTELVLSKAGIEEVLLTNFRLKRNNSDRIISFSISPSQRWVALSLIKHGSLDDFELLVYDLAKRTIVIEALHSTGQEVAWETADRFVFERELLDDKPFVFTIDMRSPGTVSELADRNFFRVSRGWSYAWELLKGYVFRNADGRAILINETLDIRVRQGPVLGSDETNLFLATKSVSGFSNVVQVTMKNGKKQSRVVIGDVELTTDRAFYVDGTLFVEGHEGAKKWLAVYDAKRSKLSWIALPDATSVSDVAWQTKAKLLRLTLSGPVNEKKNFIYDFEKMWFLEHDVASQMLELGGKRFRSEVVLVKSADGTKFPVRLTYLMNSTLPRKRPVLINAYGGFGLPGYMHRGFEGLHLEFMKRGGILAAPALRGGNEFGDSWYAAGKLLKKQKTVEDLIAAADMLAAKGYAMPHDIIISGASNGGMVVAAAALKSPKSFGLVIAINGVQNLFAKETLDSRTEGWPDEYGDSKLDVHAREMIQYSPVQRAAVATYIPNFLILNGIDDSRVNALHSYQLGQALLSNTSLPVESTLIYSVKNAGHWLASLAYQNTIGWRSQTVIWTRIYDHLGWGDISQH